MGLDRLQVDVRRHDRSDRLSRDGLVPDDRLVGAAPDQAPT